MTNRVGDKEAVFALLDAMKYSIDYDDSSFNLDTTSLIVDDYVLEMMHNKPSKGHWMILRKTHALFPKG